MRLVLVAFTALMLTGSSARIADGTTDCASHTAWTGSETPRQHGTATLATMPILAPLTLTHLTVSISYAQRSAPVGFSELLLLVGVSDTPLIVGPRLLPAMTVDPAFGQRVSSEASHNGGVSVGGDVIAARILKSFNGAASALIDVDLSRSIPVGGVLWVRYDSVSTQTLDPEIQTVATYTRCS